VVKNAKTLRKTIERLQAAGIRVSMFIEPMGEQIVTAADLGAEAVELHTGAYANAVADFREDELERLRAAQKLAAEKGLIVNAGHGINYNNVGPLLGIQGWNEFNIGHSIISRALFVGLENAVRDMVRLVKEEPNSR
jgi:pyridoxine 5-phosphate synthase